MALLTYPYPGLRKIVSGGQDGVDRGALEAAANLAIPTGGWAPKGYRTTRGSDYDLQSLGLREHSSPQYPPRTRQNVIDSDATLIIASDLASPGTTLTVRECVRHKKPHKVLKVNQKRDWVLEVNVEEVAGWVVEHNVEVLNVAGNSQEPAYHRAVAFEIVTAVLHALQSV